MVKQFRQVKRNIRTGRSARRKFGRRQMIMKKGRIIHFFKRSFKQEISITNSGFQAITSDGTNYNDFKLNQLPNYSDFTNLYDTYKICGIRQKFVFNRNNADVSVTSPITELPMLVTVNDFNDDGALANENEALEYSTFKQARLDRPIKRYFRPTEQTVAGGTTSTDYMKSKWTSTEAPERIHRGLKVAVDTINSASGTTIGTLCIYTTYYVACRTPK